MAVLRHPEEIAFYQVMESEFPNVRSNEVYADWIQDRGRDAVASFVRRGAWVERLWSYDVSAPAYREHENGHQMVLQVRDHRKYDDPHWLLVLTEHGPTAKENRRVFSYTRMIPDNTRSLLIQMAALADEGVYLFPHNQKWVDDNRKFISRSSTYSRGK